MKSICEGRKTKREVIDETIEQYWAVYVRSQQRMDSMMAVSVDSLSGGLVRTC